jgi:hypothetical protein
MGHLRRNKSAILGSGSAGGGTPPSSMTHSEAGDYSSAQWQYGLPSLAGVLTSALAATAAAAAWRQQQLPPVDSSSSHSMGQRLYSGSFDNGSSGALAAAGY